MLLTRIVKRLDKQCAGASHTIHIFQLGRRRHLFSNDDLNFLFTTMLLRIVDKYKKLWTKTIY